MKDRIDNWDMLPEWLQKKLEKRNDYNTAVYAVKLMENNPSVRYDFYSAGTAAYRHFLYKCLENRAY